MHTRHLALAASLCAALAAQSPLTTTYAAGNGFGTPAMMWFNVTVNTAVAISQIDINAGTGSTAGSIDVFTIAGSHVGFETNSAAWTNHGNVAIPTPNPQGVATPCVLPAPITLAPGTYGFAIAYNPGIQCVYTDGPLGPFSTAEMSLFDGGSGNIWGGIINTPRMFNGAIHYTSGSGYATSAVYGSGCPARSSVAVYELFSNATFDLSSSSLLFIPNSNGSYTIVPGQNIWFAGFTNNLGFGDDQCATLTLPYPFPHAGGTTTTVSACSNGFVWLGANTNTDYTATSAEFLNDMARIAACWMDLYPPGNTASGVFADLDTATGDFVITWNAVPEISQTNRISMQIALQASGIFEVRYQAGISNISHVALAGYSMGNGAADPGNSDLSTVATTPIVTGSSATPLTLASSARPTLGTSINLVTGSIVSGTTIGVNSLGFANPNFDLTPLGAPGCRQYVTPAFNSLFLVAGPSSSMPVSIPNNPALAGLHVFCQSLAFSAGLNALGVVFSNGVDLKLDIR